MTTTRAPFPVGVRAMTGDAVRRRRQLEANLVALLEAGGYDEILLPIVDFADPYAGLYGDAEQRRAYRFTGREGELITVRSDFTPMVARVIAPILEPGCIRRLFYRGDVVRCEASRLGRGREFFQVGAELVGDPSTAADVEMMVLASSLVSAAGSEPVVTISDASLLPALLRYSSIPSREWPGITAALRSKRRDFLASVTRETRSAESELLAAMIDGKLSVHDLQEAEATRMIGIRMQDTIDAAAVAGVRVLPVLDDIEPASYYSGLQFSVHAAGIGVPVGRGGRYDGLYARFGADAPAVGFTLTPEMLTAGDAEGAV